MDSRSGGLRGLAKYGKILLRMGRAMSYGRPDVVSAHWAFPSGFLASLLKQLLRRPVVLWSHGAYVSDYDERPYLLRRAVVAALRSANRVMAVSQEHRRRILAISGLKPEAVGVFTPGIDLGKLRRDKEESRARYSLDPSTPWIGFVGDLIPRKGVDILLEALASLSSLDWQLLIAGSGPSEASLKRRATSHGFDNRTLFLGMIPPEEAGMVFSASDIVAVPSRAEPFGLVAPEAMACGAAVVVSDVGGLSEIIQDGENGLRFPAGDAPALARCIERLLCDPELRKSLGRIARLDALGYDRVLHTEWMRQELLALVPVAGPQWSGEDV